MRLFEVTTEEELKDRIRSARFTVIDPPGYTHKPGPLALVWAPGAKTFQSLRVTTAFGRSSALVLRLDERGAVGLLPGIIARFDPNLDLVPSGGCLAVGLIDGTIVCACLPSEGTATRLPSYEDGWPRRADGLAVVAYPAVPTWGDWRVVSRRSWRRLLFRAGLWDVRGWRADADCSVRARLPIAERPKPVRRIEADAPIRGVKVAPSGEVILDVGKEVQVWDPRMPDGPLVRRAVPTRDGPARGPTIVNLLSPRLFALEDHSARPQAVRFIDITTGREQHVFPAGAGLDLSWGEVASDTEGNLVVWCEESASHPRTAVRLRAVTAVTGGAVLDMSIPLLAPGLERVSLLSVTADGGLAAFGGDQVATLGAVDIRQEKTLWHKEVRGWVTALALGPRGKRLIAGNDMGQISLYDARSGAAIWRRSVSRGGLLGLFGDDGRARGLYCICDVAVSPDGRFFCATFGHQVVLGNVETGEMLKSFATPGGSLWTPPCFAADGKGLWIPVRADVWQPDVGAVIGLVELPE